MRDFQHAANRIQKHPRQRSTQYFDDFVPLSSEPDDASTDWSDLELEALGMANRFFTKREMRHDLRRFRREYMNH